MPVHVDWIVRNITYVTPYVFDKGGWKGPHVLGLTTLLDQLGGDTCVSLIMTSR